MSIQTFLARHKKIVLTLAGLCVYSTVVVYATPPGSPYGAGETLDPACVPGDTNCSVDVTPTLYTDGTISGTGTQTDPFSVVGSSDSVPVLSVGAATTTALSGSPTYNNGSSGVGATLTEGSNGAISAIDGATLSVGTRVLVKNQVADIQNGVYIVTALGSGSAPYVLTRTTDSDESSEFTDQIASPSAGTTNKGKLFAQGTDDPVIGTDSITYTRTTALYVGQKATGTQVAGQIPFWTSKAKQLSKGSSNLFWNSTSNRLGIGTATPTVALDVTGSGHLTGSLGVGVAPSWPLQVATAVTATGGVANGALFSQTITAAADNDVLRGLTINSTFAHAGHTSISDIVLGAYAPTASSAIFRLGKDNSFKTDFIVDSTNGNLDIQAANNLVSINGTSGMLEAGYIGLGVHGASGAFLNIKKAVSNVAQLNLESSAGVDKSSPANGDLWWNGTNLYFNNGTTNKDLLASSGGGSGTVTNVTASAPYVVTSTSTTTPNVTRRFNILDYGAKINGRVVGDVSITSGSANATFSSTTFTNADVGKYIKISGAGVGGYDKVFTISAVGGAHSITLNTTASSTVSSGIAKYGTDDTAAWQAATNAAVANGGGQIIEPTGISILAGNLQSPSNSIIVIPNITQPINATDQQAVVLEYTGEIGASWDETVISDTLPSTDGSVVMAFTTGSGTYPSILAAAIAPGTDVWSYVDVSSTNIDWQVTGNTANGAALGGLNFGNVINSEVHNSKVTVDVSLNHIVGYTNAYAGIIMTRTNGGTRIILDNPFVAGFKYGIIFGEHTQGSMSVFGCQYGLLPTSMNLPAHFTKANLQWNVHGISTVLGGLYAHLNIDLMDLEHWPDPAPYQFVDDVNDPSNYLKGNAYYGASTSGAGYNQGAFVKTGGAGFYTHNMDSAALVGDTWTGSEGTDITVNNPTANKNIFLTTSTTGGLTIDPQGRGIINSVAASTTTPAFSINGSAAGNTTNVLLNLTGDLGSAFAQRLITFSYQNTTNPLADNVGDFGIQYGFDSDLGRTASRMVWGGLYNGSNNTTPLMILRDYGGLGIGGSVPDFSAQLDVQSTTRGVLLPRMTTSQQNSIASPANGLLVYNTTDAGFNYWNGSAWTAISSGGGGGGGGGSTSIGDTIGSAIAGSVLYINGSTQLAQDNSNYFYDATNHRLGLGTTSPVSKLHVKGTGGTAQGLTIEASASNSYGAVNFYNSSAALAAQFLETNSGFTSGIFQPNQTALYNYETNGSVLLGAGDSSGSVSIATGGYSTGNERFRIGNSGQWSLNTVAGTANQIPGVNSGATAMEWKTVTAGTGISVTHGTGTITIASSWTSALQVSGSNLGVNTSGAPSFNLQVGQSSVSGIVARFQNSSGTCDINPTSTALSCSSDRTLKKNITPLDKPVEDGDHTTITDTILAKVLSLQPVTYNWNAESDTDPTHAGFIAQDVQAIFPDLVSEDSNTHLLSLNYLGLIPYTIKALQEIDLRIGVLPVETDQTFTDRLAAFLKGIAEAGNAVIEHVHTNELCITDESGDVCVTAQQLRTLLQPAPIVIVQQNQGTTDATDTGTDSGGNDDSGDTGDTTTTTGAADTGTSDQTTDETSTSDTPTTSAVPDTTTQ